MTKSANCAPRNVITWEDLVPYSRCIAFSSDGAGVVTASAGHKMDKIARIWSSASGDLLATLVGHSEWVARAQFSPDDNRVITGSYDATARLWDARTGNELAVIDGHKGPLSTAAFSPDGSSILTASMDHTARIWKGAAFEKVIVLAGHLGGITEAIFSPNSRRVVTVSNDHSMRLWDAETGLEIALLDGPAVRPSPDHFVYRYIVSFSGDGSLAVIASSKSNSIPRVCDAGTGAVITQLVGHIGNSRTPRRS